MIHIRRGAVATLLALALPLASAGIASATGPDAASTPSRNTPARALSFPLPHPTGPYTIGRDRLHLVDHGHKDPRVPSAAGRELMVSRSWTR